MTESSFFENELLVEAAERGDGLGSRLAVDGESLCPLINFHLRAGAAEEVSVLNVQSAEAVLFEALLELADVVADAAPLENAGEAESDLDLRDLGFRPEGRPAERVPGIAAERELDHAGVAAPRLDHVEVGIDDVAYVSGAACRIDLEHEIPDAELVLRDLHALVVKPVRGEIVFQHARDILKPEHAEAGAVESAENVAVACITLLLPECDRTVGVRLGSLSAADPCLGNRRRGLSLRSPDVDGMVLHLSMQALNKILEIIRLQHYHHPPFQFRYPLPFRRGCEAAQAPP